MSKPKSINKDQRKFLSDFLNGLSIAWFSAGIITPLFVGFDNLVKLSMQIAGSLCVSGMLLFIGIRNLK